MESLVRAYFDQSRQYFSESGVSLRLIDAMHPAYAANAADKLLRDAEFWAKEAGVSTPHPALWMVNRPLFRALTRQANA